MSLKTAASGMDGIQFVTWNHEPLQPMSHTPIQQNKTHFANSFERTRQEQIMGRDHPGTSASNADQDRILSLRIGRIGIAPSPEQYSSAITSSIEALLEKEKALQDAMDSLQSRCHDEEQALMSIIEGLKAHRGRQESIIYSSLSTLRWYRNFLIPVARLPPEIMFQIFVFTAQMVNPEDWIKAARTSSRVCKRWREIALDCPELWSRLDFDSRRYHPRWLEKLVKRSRSALLSFSGGHRVDDWSKDERMALVINNLHRFRSIKLGVPDNADPLFKIFSQSAPVLQDLTISSNDRRNFAFPPEFLGGYAPNLRRIKLNTASHVPWDSPLFVNLTTLEIEGPGYNYLRLSSLEMFLNALNNMTGLELLTLREVIPPPARSTVEYVPVNLPNLKRLELDDYLWACADFLGKITINLSATLLLAPRCNDVVEQNMYDRFLEVFRSHPWTTPTPTSVLNFTWEDRDFRVDAWLQQGEAIDSVNPGVDLRMRRVPDELWSLGVAQACFAGFASPNLRSFRVSGDIIKWDIDWRTVARMAPYLQRLHVERAKEAVELCKALCPPDGLNSAPADCIFPELSYLELTARYNRKVSVPRGGKTHLSAVLARNLAARAAIGCSTPEVVFIVPPSREPPGRWSEALRDAIPGIVVREHHDLGKK